MILVAGLTPAWQQILTFDALNPGEVNRATSAIWCGSGKVLNVARAVATLLRATNQVADCLTLSPLGGLANASIVAEFREDNIPLQVFESSAPTRICTTLLEKQSRRTTELVENASAFSEDDLQRFKEQFFGLAKEASVVILTGSLPAGTRASFTQSLLMDWPQMFCSMYEDRNLRQRLSIDLGS